MKGIVWLISGLGLALLLVSGVSVGSRLSLSNSSSVQDLRFVGQISRRAVGQISQGLNAQATFLNNNPATVISTWGLVSSWISPFIDWFCRLWSDIVEAWKRFLGLFSDESKLTNISPAMREQLRQELLVELERQGLLNSLPLSGGVAGTKYGIMVVPSTGSTTRDELFKKNLSRVFADSVRLKFDREGLTGVITPTFSDGSTGSDYIFVLNPIP